MPRIGLACGPERGAAERSSAHVVAAGDRGRVGDGPDPIGEVRPWDRTLFPFGKATCRGEPWELEGTSASPVPDAGRARDLRARTRMPSATRREMARCLPVCQAAAGARSPLPPDQSVKLSGGDWRQEHVGVARADRHRLAGWRRDAIRPASQPGQEKAAWRAPQLADTVTVSPPPSVFLPAIIQTEQRRPLSASQLPNKNSH